MWEQEKSDKSKKTSTVLKPFFYFKPGMINKHQENIKCEKCHQLSKLMSKVQPL